MLTILVRKSQTDRLKDPGGCKRITLIQILEKQGAKWWTTAVSK